jgi:hypothetical protein
MVQVVENWADVTGVVQSVMDQGATPAHARVQLKLTDAADVDTKPNFFRQRVGTVVDVHLLRDAVPSSLRPGSRVALRVRAAAADKAFASSDGLRVMD